jgi:FSR family fosmidomycin resistance protein-like MFS transporter
VLVKLGQDCLPGRHGTAARVTHGHGVSIGGMCAPLLGLAAQSHGPQGVFTILCAAPLAAWALGLMLTEPRAAVPAPAVPAARN